MAKKHKKDHLQIPMILMLLVIIALAGVIVFKLIGSNSSVLTKAEVKVVDYVDETGTVTGTHGIIEVSGQDAQNISEKQFKYFIEKVVKAGGYKLFTIKFPNRTGIAFTDASDKEIRYGYLDENDRLTEIFGFITQNRDGSMEYQQY